MEINGGCGCSPAFSLPILRLLHSTRNNKTITVTVEETAETKLDFLVRNALVENRTVVMAHPTVSVR